MLFTHSIKKEGTPTFTTQLEGNIIKKVGLISPFSIPVGEWSPYTINTYDDLAPTQVTANKIYYIYFNQTGGLYTGSYSAKDSSVQECQISYSYIIDSTTYSECTGFGSGGHMLGATSLGYLKSNFVPKASGILKSFTFTFHKWNEEQQVINFIITDPVSCSNACTSSQKVCDLDGYRVCGDYNGDGCSEWGNVVSCPGSCSNGNCATNCNTPADSNCDGCVSDIGEWGNAVINWKAQTGGITDDNWGSIVIKWKSQEGC